ncbi:Ankyrin repeat domain-containing protein 29 [Trichinella spiralis]|uniref:Ankyrin repeat domain-containing protein 29 n=1 Tax=Trichinella spiralis TaxID=6334 RepID=A0A0V1BRY2_TRISP|nr:Ankyrin repeat domain-containing protein 29 [Trichinella spiralis]
MSCNLLLTAASVSSLTCAQLDAQRALPFKTVPYTGGNQNWSLLMPLSINRVSLSSSKTQSNRLLCAASSQLLYRSPANERHSKICSKFTTNDDTDIQLIARVPENNTALTIVSYKLWFIRFRVRRKGSHFHWLLKSLLLSILCSTFDVCIFILTVGIKETHDDNLLHNSSSSGDVDTLQHVLNSGRVRIDCCDSEGTTALMLASAQGHFCCVRILVEAGADVNIRRKILFNATSYRLTEIVPLKSPPQKCGSMHSRSANTGGLLLLNLFSIGMMQHGTTALFFAAEEGHLEIARFLLESGFDVVTNGGMALFIAAQGNYMTIVKTFLEVGCDPNYSMSDGAHSLFVAAQNGHLEVVKILLQNGADVSKARNDGATPLWISCQMGHASIVRELLLWGANVDEARKDGATPLFKASHKGHTAVVEELLEFDPCLGLLANGETALHAACLFGHQEIAKMLIRAGADVQLLNQAGETPLQLAEQLGYDSIINLLSKFIQPAKTVSKETIL